MRIDIDRPTDGYWVYLAPGPEPEPWAPVTVRKGQWYCHCCERDLEQADEDETFTFDEDIRPFGVWDTEREALLALIENGGDVQECERRLKELDKKGL